MKEFIKKFIPQWFLSFYHFILALLGAIIYRFLSSLRQGFSGQAKKIKVIGVTGTNGKTTTTEMISKIFEEAGYKVALSNSIRFKIGEKEEQNLLKMTMPGRFKIQKFLRQAVISGCQYAVLEVTSEGIKQHRHRFIDFDVAVFTNLSPEHIEAHGSFENYRAAKGKLFQATKNIHIINLDDENANYYLQFPAKSKYGYMMKEKRDQTLIQGSPISTISLQDIQPLNLKLPGEFNLSNALAAIAVGLSQGIDLEISKKALEKMEGIPGRIEEVISYPFKVFVDYAVTPDALEKIYELLSEKFKKQYQSSKMICVFGACGGGRDKWKRPVLGEVAAKYCDEIIITNEDPYDEDPYQILSMLKAGIFRTQFSPSNFYEILDRRQAIRKSLQLAKTGDIVIITGKGCEPWMCLANGKKIPWDDREAVREEFKLLKENKA